MTQLQIRIQLNDSILWTQGFFVLKFDIFMYKQTQQYGYKSV